MLDDTIVYRLPEDDEDYLFIPNAGHDEEVYDRWVAHRDEWGMDADVENVTSEYAMVAVQGPDAVETLAETAGPAVRDVTRFTAEYVDVAGVECWTARTGYTGEDGFELVLPVDGAEAVWGAIDCQPCGLGARDTLRMEAGLLLSGQDFHPEDNPRNPYEAGIGFAVKLDTEFVGRDALEAVHAEGPDEKFVGLKLIDRGVPRTGYEIALPDGEVIGEVTSGTMSPTLGEPIGLGYVPVEYSEPGTMVRVVVRGEPKKAKIHTPRFLE
jgi:aminomethyltransferase